MSQLDVVRAQIADLRAELGELQQEPIGQTLREMRQMSAEAAIETLEDSQLDGTAEESRARDRLEAHAAGTAYVVTRNAAAALSTGPLNGLRVPNPAIYRSVFQGASDDSLVDALKNPTVGATQAGDTAPVINAIVAGAEAAFGTDNPFNAVAFAAVEGDAEATRALAQEALLRIRDEAEQVLQRERQESIEAHCTFREGVLDAEGAAGMATHAIGPISTDLFALQSRLEGLEARLERLPRSLSFEAELATIQRGASVIESELGNLQTRWNDVRFSAAVIADPASSRRVEEGNELCAELTRGLTNFTETLRALTAPDGAAGRDGSFDRLRRP